VGLADSEVLVALPVGVISILDEWVIVIELDMALELELALVGVLAIEDDTVFEGTRVVEEGYADALAQYDA